MRRRRSPIVGLLISLGMLLGLVVVAALLATQRSGPSVLSITPAKSLDDAYHPIDPTDTFAPEDTFFVSVELDDYDNDSPLLARWYYEESFITETHLEFDYEGDVFAGFVLLNEDPPWPLGRYSVEIVYRERVLGSADFRVKP